MANSTPFKPWLVCLMSVLTIVLSMTLVSCGTVFDEHHVSRKLPPVKRDHERRGLPDADLFMPRPSIVLDYGHGSYYSPKATVTFIAYSDHPIVLIEAFDGLLSAVNCATGAVDLHFLSEDAARQAASSWNNHNTFRAVTSHPGCNLDDERGAWSVDGITTDVPCRKISLSVKPLALNDIGESFEVAFGQKHIATRWTTNSAQTIGRRAPQNTGFKNIFSGIHIFPGNASAGGLSESLLNQLTASSLEVVCTDCSSNFNFSVDINFNVSNVNSTVTAASVATVVELFEQSVVLDVSMNRDLSASPSFDFLHIPIPDIGVSIPNVLDFGASIGIGVDLELDMNGALNFTLGAKGSISSGTTATTDFLQQNATNINGWDNASVESVPLRLNSGQLNMTMGATLAPFIELSATVGGQFGAQARLTLNVPHIDVVSTVSSQVNRECNPIGDNDFESFGTAYLVTADMNLEAIATFNADLGVVMLAETKTLPYNDTLFQKQVPLLNGTTNSDPTSKQCYVVANDNASAVPSAGSNGTDPAIITLQPAPTGTLLVAASAIPTFNLTKIESYFSANGQLPTGVNYTQLAQATTLPDNLKTTIQKAAQPTASSKPTASIKPSSTATGKASLRDGIVMYWMVVLSALYMVFM
ncbi:hypothetical protein BDZ97DRAFT_1755254 [Flammula alnicola]|nr:hypothetical protein BDZ97DRAFT_1755254 [Flammula alnicola]